jgi:uncharacterized protein (DUF58 family)
VRPTRRGVAVLAGAAALVASGWWLRYPLLTALGAAGLATVAAALLVARRAPRAEVTCTVRPDRVERGRPAVAVLSVRPAGVPVTIRVAAPGPVNVVRTAATAEYRLPTGVRGRFPVGPFEVSREDPLGLASYRHRTGRTTTLTVHPRQLPTRPGSAADDLRPGSDQEHGVREYEPGDEIRHLHWKATAHTGRLMVRELADPWRARLTVLLDTRTGSLSAADFEEAVDVAASLIGAATRVGLRTRLFTAGGEVTGHLLEALTDVRQGDGGTPAADGGGRLVLITGESAAPARPGPAFSSVVVLALGPGVGAEQALRGWNEAYR